MQPTIAFLGTGYMGFPMATNLLAAGFPLRVWNRSLDKAQGLVERGAAVAQTPGEAVGSADVVVSMLTDGAAVDKVIAAALPSLKQGALWIDMSSTYPQQARAQADSLKAAHVSFIDAPVSGGTKGAQEGRLAILVGGTEADFARATPVFAPLGRATRLGPVGSGQLAKLANQAIVGITIGAVAEAMLLVERGGGSGLALREALQGGFADSTILQLHGGRMMSGDYTPGAPASIQLKDMRNILAQAAQLGLELPLAQQIEQRYQALVSDLDGANKDHAALYLELQARQEG